MSWFFENVFVSRGQCGPWERWLMVQSIVANGVTALCYFVIPLILFEWYLRRRKAFNGSWISLGFVGFILICGLHHVCEVWSFHRAYYRFFAQVDFVMMLFSLFTVGALLVFRRHFLTYHSPEELRKIIESRDVEIHKNSVTKAKILERSNLLKIKTESLEKQVALLRQQVISGTISSAGNTLITDIEEAIRQLRQDE